MNARILVSALMLGLWSGCSSSRPGQAPASAELVAISYAGDSQIPHRRFLADPFEQAHPGVRVRLVPSESEDVVAQIKAAHGAPPYDVIPLGEPRQITAIQEGWVERIPPQDLPNLKEVHPRLAAACRDHGVPETYSIMGLAYNRSLVPKPEHWVDLWRPEYRRKLGITTPASNLGFAFLVAAARLYGGQEDNLDPVWTKLKELEPFQVAPNPTSLAQLFERGEIAVAPLWNNVAAILKGKGLPVSFAQPRPGAVVLVSCLSVIRGSANARLARQYVNAVLTAEYQSKAAQAPFFFGPTNKRVAVPANAQEYLPQSEEEFSRLATIDWEKAAAQRARATERFNREFSR